VGFLPGAHRVVVIVQGLQEHSADIAIHRNPY
jgi:hypothetical protein